MKKIRFCKNLHNNLFSKYALYSIKIVFYIINFVSIFIIHINMHYREYRQSNKILYKIIQFIFSRLNFLQIILQNLFYYYKSENNFDAKFNFNTSYIYIKRNLYYFFFYFRFNNAFECKINIRKSICNYFEISLI